ncbi:hypothetical protein ACM39_02520 [Chryseobacterium sp. FH2]|uniref:hypothetical protein n=1 Tax=Chryseobacterium sp. FH2 TaxID=1674291 RepID=UPI00065AE1A8|nr:hypothetical protein [Chryseobacterium sp. FH2]KMQ69933.1 hypothetical protein ACM39_02520 [Chryseobacterium sp. FH2]
MNSTLTSAEQLKIYSNFNQQLNLKNMETPNHNQDIVFDEDLYTIEWIDIENAEIDYENYLSDIENFFREDFENETIEKDIF